MSAAPGIAAILALTTFSLVSAPLRQVAKTREEQPRRVPKELIPPAPWLPAEQALKTFKVKDGLQIECIAHEPLVESPVALTFGPDGRIWVCEMRGFMPNADGSG